MSEKPMSYDPKMVESANNKLDFVKFNTGATRSSDANSVSLYLVSPIALKQLARYCSYASYATNEPLDKYNYIELAIANVYQYLSGDHDCTLEAAAFNVFKAIQTEPSPKINSRNGYGLIPIEGLLAVARAYREGELKYCAYNCELSFPVHDLLNHCLLHLFKFLKDDTTEDQLGHAGWNLFMAMHSEELWPHLNKGHLRQPDCQIGEDIKEAIKVEMEKKKR